MYLACPIRHRVPSEERRAESFPLIIPHSKSSQGPQLSLPSLRFALFAALSAPFQTVSMVPISGHVVTSVRSPAGDRLAEHLVHLSARK
jgi:hypothetical protein